MEDAYAYSKFARIVLNTNDIDFRARPHSSEETQFLATRVAGTSITISYSDLESAPVVLLAGFEPEEESPIVYLRLRKAARKHGLPVHAIAPFASNGLKKLSGKLIQTVPGAEATALDGLATGELGELLSKPGAIISSANGWPACPADCPPRPGLPTPPGLDWRGCLAAPGNAARWKPARCRDCCPAAVRSATRPPARRWPRPGMSPSCLLPTGRDVDGILAAATDGTLGALLVGGVDPDDFADPDAVLAALDAVGFVVSLELRHSAVTERADVVFPIAPAAEKSGTYVNWEGRRRSFSAALPADATPDLRVLDTLADEMGIDLGLPTVQAALVELSALGSWDGTHGAAPDVAAAEASKPGAGEAVLAGWRMLLDQGRLQDGEPHLAGTARAPVVRLSAETADEIGAADGDRVTVSTARGEVTLPLTITEMPEQVVWLPLNSPGSAVHRQLGVTAGAVVKIPQ